MAELPNKYRKGTGRPPRVHFTFRREILDAARELFINEGYEKFTMRKLAQKIGYSPTTIYIYFKGKDDLLLAIKRIRWRESELPMNDFIIRNYVLKGIGRK